jgi:hypothetical protein
MSYFQMYEQICQSVWSPFSVESTVQELCEPFLKAAALIKFHFFGDEFPSKTVSCIALFKPYLKN